MVNSFQKMNLLIQSNIERRAITFMAYFCKNATAVGEELYYETLFRNRKNARVL